MVGGALDIGLAAQGVDPAARHANVAQQQLDDAHGTDVLDADGMLGPAHGIHDGARLARRAGGPVSLVDLQQVGLGRSGHRGDELGGVALVVLLEQVEHAARVLEAGVLLGNPLVVEFKSPFGIVVFAILLVVAAKQAVLEAEVLSHHKRRVGVIDHVLLVIELVFQDVLDHPAQKSDVGSRAQSGVNIRL